MTRRLELSEAERTTLEQAVRHHPKAYARERAAALVKIADRTPAARVAARGLLTRRKPDTVYRWLDAYEAEGLAVLTIRAGRGRKPRLSPPGERRAGGAARGPAGAAGE